MVKLSGKYLIRKNKADKHFLNRGKGDTDKQFLKGITHLPLQNHFIDRILKIEHCENVKFLYLQNNLLKAIENVQNFPNLTHLYLQRNFLVKIENLNSLQKLKKIYLGRNEIQVLEGMENLKEIKEIHFERQILSSGDTIYFEPLTIQNLGATLQVLDVSGNYLASILGLRNLSNLRVLIASDNSLSDVEDLTATISEWRFLQEVNFIGNRVTQSKEYQNSIILASKTLEILDQLPVHPNTRIYLENLAEKKKNFLAKKQKNRSNQMEKKKGKKALKFKIDQMKDDCFEFTNSFPPERSVSLHPSWKLRKNVNSTDPKAFLPRPYWRKGGLHERKFGMV